MVTRGLTKAFGTKHERDLRILQPRVAEINEAYEQLAELSDEALQAKTEAFRARLAAGETLDDLMVEAFAVVKEACRRHVGQSWSVVGHETLWEMVPYDVQLIGAIVLHEGKIAEMATGEGKTLVAVMPLYLNALAGKGCHLVTVNDYLARRDSEWMGQILRFLGLRVGVIQHDMDPAARRAAYACDVTYGTNNEFGFDFLRDNMAVRKEDQVQRPHFYAIVDEVDSVLVDEARTPLIISGPVAASDQRYDSLRDPVDRLVRGQTRRVTEILGQAETLLGEAQAAAERGEAKLAGDKEYEAGVRLLQVQRGAPKHKRFLKLVADENLKPLIQRVEGDFMRDKRLHTLDDDLYYSIDEREHSINLSDEGRAALHPGDPDYFVLPDLSERVGAVDADESLSPKERVARKQEIHLAYARKADELHTIHQLLRAFCLYEQDVEYVVQDGKVMIVDEFTGRLMPGRRFSEGLHQALEAKERVRVEGETQTWATITLQNYFRLYEKLAGMTGTAETEASELWEIYKLDVVVIPTNEPIRRIDYNDQIFRTRREKYNAIIEEISFAHQQGRPVLVGTVSVEVSETLSRMLKRRGINHAVLNAKQHQSEAEIVTRAGRPGAVTIATNMAGRGTDIKLGEGVVKGRKCLIESGPEIGDCDAVDDPAPCMAEMPCGLHIVGTERHESRRIDRQLRGRSGRQGDPGSSRFFLSLEDDLMRLFGSDRVSALMERMGAQEGEVIQHDFVTKAIERAQKRVEARNFEIRKHLLEYDNVMNQQREVIYGIRNQILAGQNLAEEFRGLIEETVESRLDPALELWRGRIPDLDEVGGVLQETGEELERIFLAPFPLLDWAREAMGGAAAEDGVAERLAQRALATAREAYAGREAEWGEQIAREIERRVYLRVIDDHWKDHLYELDLLRGGVGLRAYGQKDPLLEYKGEAFRLFEAMMGRVSEETLVMLFR
ncbi:MAG: preprotein translocase subunit SecA, partial [Candidatus Eisenbacteria bacterium]|nr:preprotein translocase subunit SecA [Candidatus Eisenbacteria bacterium]